MSEKHGQILKEDVPELPTNESLREAQFLQEVIRGESSRNHIHKATLVLLWGIVGAFAILGVTWLYHQIFPVAWHYLRAKQISYLGTILFSGGGSALLANQFSTWLRKNTKPQSSQ